MGTLRLYTVGHSSHSLEEFLSLLQRHGINCVVDVRSVPASKYAPQFNEESLRRFLKLHNMKGLKRGFRIALMCSEADPLECHRFSLVSRYFHNQGIEVFHILKDAELVTQCEVEKRMVNEFLHSRKYHLAEVDELFGTYTVKDQLNDAYRLKNKEIGYKPSLQLEEEY